MKVNLEKIKSIRKEKNISLEDMSRKVGYESPNGYYYLETGKRKFPANTLAQVSKILNTPINELFFED